MDSGHTARVVNVCSLLLHKAHRLLLGHLLGLSIRHLLVVEIADANRGHRLANDDLGALLVLQVGAVRTLAIVDGDDPLSVDLGLGAVVTVGLCLYLLIHVHR